MPQVPANFQVIDNHLNLGIDESRLVRSHVTALRFRLSPSTSSDSVALSRITRKRRKKPTIYELQLRSPDPSASHVCVDADTVLRVNTVDPFETLAIPYEPRLDPILHHCQYCNLLCDYPILMYKQRVDVFCSAIHCGATYSHSPARDAQVDTACAETRLVAYSP